MVKKTFGKPTVDQQWLANHTFGQYDKLAIAITRHCCLEKEQFSHLRALVQWLWEDTHIPKVVGSNPGAVYWMDMTFKKTKEKKKEKKNKKKY